MTFPTRTLSALLLAATTALAVLPTAAEARNGQNAALVAGALLGLAAGSTLAHAGEDEAPPPRYLAPPRFVEPVDDEDLPQRPIYRAPHYRAFDDGWYRHEARFRAYDGRPCPDRGWGDTYGAE